MVFGATRGTLDASELALLRREASARALEGRLRPDAPQRAWLEALDSARPDWELPVALAPDDELWSSPDSARWRACRTLRPRFPATGTPLRWCP